LENIYEVVQKYHAFDNDEDAFKVVIDLNVIPEIFVNEIFID
jgi:hypothetical protein